MAHDRQAVDQPVIGQERQSACDELLAALKEAQATLQKYSELLSDARSARHRRFAAALQGQSDNCAAAIAKAEGR